MYLSAFVLLVVLLMKHDKQQTCHKNSSQNKEKWKLARAQCRTMGLGVAVVGLNSAINMGSPNDEAKNR
jgi:hypothetical protein